MNTILERIAQLTAEKIQQEESDFDVRESNLIQLVRANYENWIKLFEVLKLKKIGCYDYLVELLASPEIGIHTTNAALRKAFSRVRADRGERVFKQDGVARANQHWDNKAGRGKGVTLASHSVPQKIERARYSLREVVPASTTKGVRSEAIRPAASEGASHMVAQAFKLSWSLDGPTPVFQGVELPRGKLVSLLALIAEQVSAVVDYGSAEDCRSAKQFLLGFMKKNGYDAVVSPTGTVDVESSMWPPAAISILNHLESGIPGTE